MDGGQGTNRQISSSSLGLGTGDELTFEKVQYLAPVGVRKLKNSLCVPMLAITVRYLCALPSASSEWASVAHASMRIQCWRDLSPAESGGICSMCGKHAPLSLVAYRLYGFLFSLQSCTEGDMQAQNGPMAIAARYLISLLGTTGFAWQ